VVSDMGRGAKYITLLFSGQIQFWKLRVYGKYLPHEFDKPIGKIVLIYIRLYLISPALSENIQLFLLQMKYMFRGCVLVLPLPSYLFGLREHNNWQYALQVYV
jgi:hypothetical protein